MTSFSWRDQQDSPIRLRTFIRQKGISRTLLKQIKFTGGLIKVNGKEEKVNYMLNRGDEIYIQLPPEPSNDVLEVSNLPFNILYEDEHFLVIDKPAGVACLPSHVYKNDTLANRVKGYYIRKNYDNRRIHIVNRLDMDTSGIVIFAKHHFAHSVLDKQLRNHEIKKFYVAIVEGIIHSRHVEINLPIGRAENSIIQRKIKDDGKPSSTEFWVLRAKMNHSLVKIRLHTGRTHQIRVHFAAINHPLIGDWLYNPHNHELNRQALHCYKMVFFNPFTDKEVVCESELPLDMKNVMKRF
ncbi:RluA family pseudouridine synthase [Apilactobacillus bombintestini]|uniref:Pseudouridine synthase n=1 Tax=Apilactobacillus bombintestini TaxID=2419772 RepID=A0A387ASU5_9LACO|nr:RluA family pseudouridine synthase [Apilactobacillus bombintestini]AYF92419.1 RluA family pseudouridine synthase [Apilactobacillus bombintestini]